MDQLVKREGGEVGYIDRGIEGGEIDAVAFGILQEFDAVGRDFARMSPRVLNVFKGTLVEILRELMELPVLQCSGGGYE